MSKIYGFVRDSLTNFSEEMTMVYSPFTLGVFILTIVSLKIYQILRFNNKLPPGPSGYPFLGMLPKIQKEFHLELFDYSKSFGKIFSMKMGNQLIVVLSDHKLIKAAFGKSDFAVDPKQNSEISLADTESSMPKDICGRITEDFCTSKSSA